MFIILNGTKPEHLDMLDGGIIQRLLEEKWKTFAQNQFLKRLLILSTHLLCLSVSVYLRPAHDGEAEDEDSEGSDASAAALLDIQSDEGDSGGGDYNAQTVARYCAEFATLVGVLSYVIFQQGDEIKNQGLSAFLKQLVRILAYIDCHLSLNIIIFLLTQSHAPAKAIFLFSNLLILACIPFRLIGDTDTEEAILIFAVPGSWFLLMFFAG